MHKEDKIISGSIIGGQKAGATNKAKYGADYYQKIGSKGGKAKVPKGFAMMSPERLREVGIKGGKKSRRK